MRNKLLHMIYLLVFCMAVTCCVKVDSVADEASRHLVGYEVIENKPVTKATFPTSETFMSKAYKLTSGRTWDADKGSATAYFNSQTEEVKFIDSYWKTEYDYYWPQDGGSLTFFSYAPESLGATVSTDGVSINNWNVVTNAGKVILVADIAKDKTKNESYAGFSGVPTLFRHKLSKVSFRVAKSAYAEEGIDVSIKSIKIVDIYTKGNYTRGGYENDAWSGWNGQKTTSDPYVVYDSGATPVVVDNTPVQKGEDMIMIPQMLSQDGSRHPRVIVEYKTSTEPDITTAECFFVENFRSGQWAKGNHYTYTIYIGVGQYPIEFDGSVSDWSSTDMGTTIVQ